ncbi:hypothetical protein TWF281_004601 [Arthrobotrys megalospora]
MTTLPFISQLKSLVQVVTGDLDGAKKTQEQFFEAWKDHPLETLGDMADGIPVVGHIKGVVHFAMGDTEAGIRAEEGATRTLAVLGAGALVAASGGTAAPILAGVVAGMAADARACADVTLCCVYSGIESARHGGKYDPQGMVAVGTNVVRDIQRGEHPSGDIFDGIAIAVGDGMIGSSAVRGPTAVAEQRTTVYRVEGKSLIKLRGGAELEDFKAGDNQRIFHHDGRIEVRERLPMMGPAEDLSPNPPPWDSVERKYPAVKGGNLLGELPNDPSVFEDQGHMIFLNCGDADRAYGYYADKLIDHRQIVNEYRSKLRPNGPISGVTEKTHTIKVKSFEVMTRDLRQIEIDAITEAEKGRITREAKPFLDEARRAEREENRAAIAKHKALNEAKQTKDPAKRAEAEQEAAEEGKKQSAEHKNRVRAEQRAKELMGADKGVLRVDVSKAAGQYGLTNSRYTPIFAKHITGSFRSNSLWIRHLPTPILRLIRDHPIGFGKVRRFKYAGAARVLGGGSTDSSVSKGQVVRIADLAHITNEELEREDVSPLVLAHCRHVKTVRAPTSQNSPESTEHYEYLVKFDEDSMPEWYPEELIADDLKREFYQRAKESAKPVGLFQSREGGKLLVKRPDGSLERIDDHQIFWDEQEPGTNRLSLSELDAVLYHLHRDDPHHGIRIRLGHNSPFPETKVAHTTHCTERDGYSPVYFGSAIDFKGGVHPCKVAPGLRPYVRVGYDGKEHNHYGEYELLPFIPELMALVPSRGGEVPPGRRPVLGGYEDGKPLYHAIAEVNGIWVPGKAAPHLGGADVPYDWKEFYREDCKILCWK